MAYTPKNPSVDVYSVGEVAQAAGVPVARVEALVAAGRVRSGRDSVRRYFAPDQAIVAPSARFAPTAAAARRCCSIKPEFAHASPRLPIAVSSAFHAGIAATLILISTIGLPQAAEPARAHRAGHHAARVHCTPGTRRRRRRRRSSPESAAAPRAAQGQVIARQPDAGPQSAEAGRGRAEARAAAAAATGRSRSRFRRSSRRSQRSPQTKWIAQASSTSRRRKKARAADPGPAAASAPAPARASARARARASATDRAAAWAAARIVPEAASLPPRLLREVKADYTEDARRANIEGEVVLEIVVRRDGSVSDVKLMSGLPRGLNERAIAAVRQWRFAPANTTGSARRRHRRSRRRIQVEVTTMETVLLVITARLGRDGDRRAGIGAPPAAQRARALGGARRRARRRGRHARRHRWRLDAGRRRVAVDSDTLTGTRD